METKTIQPPRRPSVDLDVCVKCHGLWFDKNELVRCSMRTVVKRETTEETQWKCPRCRVPMFIDWLGGTEPVSSCEQCSGVFIEAEVVERSLRLHPEEQKSVLDELGGICPQCHEWRPDMAQDEPPDSACGVCLGREGALADRPSGMFVLGRRVL